MGFFRLLCQPLSLVSTLAVRKDGLVNEGPHKRGNIIAEAIDRIYKWLFCRYAYYPHYSLVILIEDVPDFASSTIFPRLYNAWDISGKDVSQQ